MWCSTDSTFHGDLWHQTQKEAVQSAIEWFGIAPKDWQPPAEHD